MSARSQGAVVDLTPLLSMMPLALYRGRPQRAAHSLAAEMPVHQPAILLFEDDCDILTWLTDLFDHAGYHVTAVSTADEALAQLETRCFSGMLLDLGLHDGERLSLLGHIQANAPSLPIIVLTPVMTPAITAGALSRGAFACLAEPYDRQALLALLRRALALQASIPLAND